MKRYGKYKDSGIEWIGEIPQHWDCYNLRYVLRENVKDGPHETPIWVENGIPFLSIDGIVNGELSFDNCRYIDEEHYAKYTKKLVIEENDIFIGKAASIGKIARVKTSLKFTVWSPIAVIKVAKQYSPIYFEYLFKSDLIQYQIEILSTSNTQKNIAMGDIPKIKITIPPLPEQTAIATYLDRKTAQIDDLISKKEKLIELLKEERTAMINQAVTKGLDPNVPMKDSGVEWLGEIPEGWEVKRMKELFYFGTGLSITKQDLLDDGIPCVNYGEIHSKFGVTLNTNIHKLKCVGQEYLQRSSKAVISKGDFIFADTSEDVEGAGNFTHLKNEDCVFAGYHTITAKPKSNINSSFFAFVFDSLDYRTQIRQSIKGIKVYSITQSILKNCLVLAPPQKEQNSIVNYLNRETERIYTLVEMYNEQIKLLKEYKTALISEVVTGKVKVIED